MATPEGKIKARVKKLLDQYPGHYKHMPVVSGYGKPSLDFIICFRGAFIAIETKASEKEEPTNRQRVTMNEIHNAGGLVFVIYDETTLELLGDMLAMLAKAVSPLKEQFVWNHLSQIKYNRIKERA